MTSQVLPELAKLLGSIDEVVVLEAAKLIMDLSKKEASCRAIVANEMLVSSLIKAMSSTANADLHKSISGILHNISNDRCFSGVVADTLNCLIKLCLLVRCLQTRSTDDI